MNVTAEQLTEAMITVKSETKARKGSKLSDPVVLSFIKTSLTEGATRHEIIKALQKAEVLGPKSGPMFYQFYTQNWKALELPDPETLK